MGKVKKALRALKKEEDRLKRLDVRRRVCFKNRVELELDLVHREPSSARFDMFPSFYYRHQCGPSSEV